MNETKISDCRIGINDKVNIVKQHLASGMTRGEIAVRLGYGNWRSLDIFMRRAGFRWDGKLNKYIHDEDIDQVMESEIPHNSTKVSKIMALFGSIDADPKEIAKQTGFEDHHAMASYMLVRGFLWSDEINNYIKASQAETDDDNLQARQTSPAVHQNGISSQSALSDEDGYSELLGILMENKDRLMELLMPEKYSHTIPRYLVPGITRTKSFYMSDPLSRLLTEFCNEKNLSQKEVIEAALIEFLSKYSYKKAVDVLIRGR